MIPECNAEAVIDHVCMVHSSVSEYSKLFQQTLRRSNYVTPKNFLDFISTCLTLLEDKDKYILGKSAFVSCCLNMFVSVLLNDICTRVHTLQHNANVWRGVWIS